MFTTTLRRSAYSLYLCLIRTTHASVIPVSVLDVCPFPTISLRSQRWTWNEKLRAVRPQSLLRGPKSRDRRASFSEILVHRIPKLVDPKLRRRLSSKHAVAKVQWTSQELLQTLSLQMFDVPDRRQLPQLCRRVLRLQLTNRPFRGLFERVRVHGTR